MSKQILNSKGEPILLNDKEAKSVNYCQQIANSLGYEVDITTLTTIVKSVVEQKFFQIAPADYLPVRVGEGAWSQELLTYRSFSIADDFETGIINTGAQNSRLAEADSAIDSITVKINNWAKTLGWSLFDLQLASKSGNWDLVTSKEKARKKNWDLGIQKVAFLGSANDANVKGLLTQTDVTSDNALITSLISGLNSTDFETLLEGIIGAYRVNCAYTTMPTHFIIPETDYNGLAVSTSETYPMKSKLERLIETFKVITQNPNFKILPLAYAAKANNTSYLNKNRYVLLNYDADSIRMDIPVDYTATMANSLNSFQFQNVGYGQFTGAKAYRPKEILYFDWA